MKTFSVLFLMIFALSFTACKKENCRDNSLGTYSGPHPIFGQIDCLLEAGSAEKDLQVYLTAMGGTVELSGNLNDNCSSLSIPQQTVDSNTFSGTFILDDSKLIGDLVFSNINITLNLRKE